MVNIIVDSKKIEDIQLMIFDKDGTLIDVYNYWSNMIRCRAELICTELNLGMVDEKKLMFEMGIDLDTKSIRPEGPVGIEKRKIVMQAAVDYLASIGFPDSAKLCFDIFEKVNGISLHNMIKFVNPIDGAVDIINTLYMNGCKIAIATTDTTERAKKAMEFLSFADKIDMIAGSDVVSNSKPDPEIIHVILDALNIDKSNAMMVGDAVTDVQSGINANLRASIGVLSGFSSMNELKKLTPYIVESVGGITVEAE